MNKKIAVVIICLVCLRLAYGGDKLLTYETRYDNPIQAIRYSPDNKYLVIGTRNKVHIEDVAKGKGVKNLDVAGEVMDFSRDGKYLALGQNGGIQVFDVSSWECIQTIAPYTVMSFKFSPDGKYIANGANTTKIVEIWEVSSGKCIKTLEGHSAAVNTVDYSPDGKTIVSGSEDGTAKIWEATTGKCVTTIGGDSGPVATVNYSPNGKSIVLCYRRTGKIQILDASSGECIKTLEESAALVRYSSDGKYIVGGVDNTVKIWEVSSGKCIKTYEIGATYGGMLSVDISPDGKKITSGSEDNGLRTWLTPWASASEANRVKSAPEFDRCDVAIGLMLKKSSWFDWDVKKLKKEKTKEGFKYSNSNGLVEFFINKEPDGTYKIKVQTDSMIQYCFVEVDTKTARWLK